MDRLKALRVILVLALASLVFGWFLGVVWLYGLAAAFLAVGLVSDRLTLWIARGWMKLAEWIGAFNKTVLLSIVYYVFLTPIALLYRLLGQGSFRREPGDVETYFHTPDETHGKDDFEKPW